MNIPLTKGLFAIIDDADAAVVSAKQWRAHKPKNSTTWYAYGQKGDYTLLSMHRLIMGAKGGELVDHVNRDGLDNRRSNLRLCDYSQNQANKVRGKKRGASSQFKGVCWAKDTQRWQASLKKNGKNFYLGQFDKEIDAAKAYDAAAVAMFGAFARINFQ